MLEDRMILSEAMGETIAADRKGNIRVNGLRFDVIAVSVGAAVDFDAVDGSVCVIDLLEQCFFCCGKCAVFI